VQLGINRNNAFIFGEITDLVSIFKIITDLVSIFKIITDLVSILRLFLRVHSTGTSFVIYLEIDTRSVISPSFFIEGHRSFFHVLSLGV
jgi:hypothetical protein